jgi:hypothetical protein
MTIHRTPQERRLQKLAEELAPLVNARERVKNLYDAITAVQADDLAASYFTMNGRISLNSVGRGADRVATKLEEDIDAYGKEE